MPERNYRRLWTPGGDAGRRRSAQETFITREQASRTTAEPGSRTLTKEKGTKPTITLQDGFVVDAEQAACAWDLLKDFQYEELPAFRWLLAQAQGRTDDAEAKHFPRKQMNPVFVNEDDTIESVTRAVLLNSLSMADGVPIIAALRFKSPVDKRVFEEVQLQLEQNCSEHSARLFRTGGWFDQMMKKADRKRGEGRSID